MIDLKKKKNWNGKLFSDGHNFWKMTDSCHEVEKQAWDKLELIRELDQLNLFFWYVDTRKKVMCTWLA